MDGTTYKTCVGCGYVITSKYLSLNGEDWHSSCIYCDECESPVFTGETTTKFHTQDGKIYCSDCVANLFQVCADCGQPAKKYVKALGKIWHPFHFTCASCKNILDTYAEVDGAAYCQPCHQRMSAKSFTRAKRRSFGTEKKEPTNKPAWAVKKTSNAGPKSALDVMHKSWFINGLNKKPPSPSPSPTPSSPSPTSNGKLSPRSGRDSPTQGAYVSRPYSPTPVPLSPTISKSSPVAKQPPRGNITPSPSPSTQNTRPAWMKEPENKPKSTWGASSPTPKPAPPPATPARPLYDRTALKPVTSRDAPPPARVTSPAPAPSYTQIDFAARSPPTKSPSTYGGARRDDHSQVPQNASNIAEILESIFRPLSEEEIGSIAFQAFPLLADIHNRGQLHNNIKHKTLYINNSGIVYLIDDADDDGKVGGSSIKFKAPEAAVSIASDIYSLGVALWTSADYLLDEEEEPALSADFCDFIGLMTDDEPVNRPPIKALLPHVERYRDTSTQYLAALLREVERKRVLRKEISETTTQKQKALGKVLLEEIERGVKLKHVDKNTLTPAAKQTNPHEVMCLFIKSFNVNKLRKVDFSKLPQKQSKMNPRDCLMQAVLQGTSLRRALVVAGYDINTLIVPVPNHPTYGTIFRDISGLFTVPKVSSAIALQICQRFTGDPPDLFVATPTDAGVYYSALVAEYFNRGVIVLQNAGRLPRKMEKYSCGYETLGYVSHSLELQLPKNLVREGARVVLIDEMLVNGGILEASRIILEQTGAIIKEVICIAELEGFGGRAKLKNFECTVHAMYTFNDNPSTH